MWYAIEGLRGPAPHSYNGGWRMPGKVGTPGSRDLTPPVAASGPGEGPATHWHGAVPVNPVGQAPSPITKRLYDSYREPVNLEPTNVRPIERF
jgi:hypothetical protein